ncbi:hypothetical protein ACX1C1_23655 [Paenibacillus sp. strain BS8-2]
MNLQLPVNEQLNEIVRLQESRLADVLIEIKAEAASGKKLRVQGQELGRLVLMLPLYCQQSSSYYRDKDLLSVMEDLGDALLGIQLPSGNVSLYNCNIDSPPDTAFTSHLVGTLLQLALRDAGPEAAKVTSSLTTFMERAIPALLTGGIHTPNHRWVMAAALAKLEELFGGNEYRERAFQFLNEGLDITEYGEWTERSNSIYNAICSYYLYTVGSVFDHKPSMEAASLTLHMMRYMMHPGDTIATEYSGRQDLGAVAYMDDRYYVAYYLLASYDQDSDLAGMAQMAERTAPRGSLALLHWMLEPERMKLPHVIAQPNENYTILFGENNQVRVPNKVPYLGPLVKHPHGAAVLRHRRDKLSITVMAGQPECMYLQYGNARICGIKLGVGWFGIGAAAFPGITKLNEERYRMEIELEGCYFGPLADEHTKHANGSYVDFPNHLREKTSVVKMKAAIEVTLLDDGMDVRVISNEANGLYLQAVCMFDENGSLSGDGLERTGPATSRLSYGNALYTNGNDCIRIEGGAHEHDELLMRNDTLHPSAIHMMMNWSTPTDKVLSFRCFTSNHD